MAKSEERETAPHLLVVIDHHEARIYRTEVHGAVPLRISPYDPHGYGRHLHSAHEWTDGKRQPERKSFYDAVANTLRGAEQVLVFGSGTGRSSAMEMLLADLREHHPNVAEKLSVDGKASCVMIQVPVEKKRATCRGSRWLMGGYSMWVEAGS